MKHRTLLSVLAIGIAMVTLAVPDLALAAEHAAAAGEEVQGAIPWTGLELHAFNLLLLLGVIGYFAGRKIRDGMRDRTTEIKHDIDESNRLRKEARERFEELEWRLAGFEERLGEMKADAEKQAEAERLAILERADQDGERLREAALRTIRSETARARMSLRQDAVALAMKLAEQRIVANVGPQDDIRLANEFFSEIDAEVTHV